MLENNSLFFSFVMPAFKAKYLAESIKSILTQTYTNFELIIIDDNSPEDLLSVVNEFKDEKISYYRNKKNIGGKNLVKQWNHCLSYAKGDYIILATDDDIYNINFLETFIPLINKYPDVNLFRSRVMDMDAKGEIKRIDKCYKEYLNKIEFYYHFLHGMKGGIPQYIFKRAVLVAKGGFVDFPLAWGSDDATALMMGEKGIVNSQEHLVGFRWSDLNISSCYNKDFSIRKFSARLIFSKWLLDLFSKIVLPNDEWKMFFQREVIDYLPIYNKLILIMFLKDGPLLARLVNSMALFRIQYLSLKDKLSILLRGLIIN